MEITDVGTLVVEISSRRVQRVTCDFLRSTESPPVNLVVGDTVLVVLPLGPDERGCVLGRVVPYEPPDRQTVTIEAERELTLKCGQGAITLRSDGKLLTRAVDIATVAERRHRIKGGTVDIN